jgi:hypothetical protein
VQAGPDGAHGDAEGTGNLVVAELLPGDEQQDVAVGAREPGQRLSQRGAKGPCGDIERRPFGMIVLYRSGTGRLAQAELARFFAAVLGDQVGGDAVEPGAGVVAKRSGSVKDASITAASSRASGGVMLRLFGGRLYLLSAGTAREFTAL